MSDRPAGAGPHDVKALMAQALVELRDAKARARRLEDRAHAPVAVVGIGCRFPGGADSPEAFRELLWRGTDAIERVPDARWDSRAYFDPDPDAAGKIASPFGGFIRDVDRFDAEFFGISPREAESMDPQHRLLLETAWRALEHANIPPAQLRGTDTGVFVGICTYDYAIRHLAGGSDCGTAYFGTGNALSAAAGRLSYLFGFTGPSLSVDTACSSSLVSVHLACQALRNGECRTSLAAGVNLILAPQTSISFSRAHMLAPDGRCKPFDASANGYARGEGCGVVVLKLLEDAQRDGDPILAVIRGSAINQDGASSGLTVPSGPAQQDVIGKALANARLRQADIGYVEAHGTGTALGDPIEARSLAAAYCSQRDLGSPLWVGSVKSNIGHLEGAAGIASLIKAVLAVQHGVIPPSLHFLSPNPNIEWLFSGLRVPTEAHPWATDVKHAAGISSFGFTGTNAHVIIEAPPVVSDAVVDAAATQAPAGESVLLPISARDPEALQRLIGEYRAALATAPSLADVAAAAALGREHFKYRRAVVASSCAEAAALLEQESQPAENALGSLAARYESGGDVDWTTVFDPAVRAKVHVPAYPFLGARHWLREKVGEQGSDASRSLETNVALDAPGLLRDHQVFGRVLVPAAALVELILSAGRRACGSDRLLLDDFIIHRPMSLDGDARRSVKTVLEPRADGFHATIVAVDARRSDQLIAEARIRAATDDVVSDDAAVAPLKANDDRSIPAMYAEWRARGLNYGPAFQTISRVERDDTVVRADIGLQPAQRDQAGYYVHPALLDGCFQAAAFSYPEPPAEQLYLPVGIRRITTFAPASFTLRCETALVRADAQRVETDICLRADDGTLIAVIEGVTSAAGTARGVDAALRDAPPQRPVPAETPIAANRSAGRDGTRRETTRATASLDAVRQMVGAILRMPPERIGSDAALTGIGLDSLMALELRNRCHAEYGVDIPAAEFIRDLTVAQIVDRIAGASAKDASADLPRERPAEDTPLSHGQRALWYLHQVQPDSPAYNIAFAVRIRSAVDEAALMAALRHLTTRHGQLRTVYRETDAGARQIVQSEAGSVYTRHDVAGLDEAELHSRVVDEYRKPFDLANGPVMRVSLFSRDRDDHVLSIAIHHIAADAWSLWRLMEEFRAFYEAETRGTTASLPVPGYEYGDKVKDEERFVQSAAGDAAWEYWQHELAGELPLLSLPTDKPRPAVQTLNGASVPFSLTMEESASLQEIARQEGATLYALLAAAFQALLHRYSGQDDIILGCPAAGRNRSEAAGTVGYFVNPIVVRARFAPDQPFRTLLGETRARILDGMSHQDLPFPVIAERLAGPRNAGHSPVFQAAFVMQQLKGDSVFSALMTPSDPPLRVDWGGLLLEHYFLPQQEGQFDLTLEMVHVKGACHGLFKYNTDLWRADSIGRMAQHFRTLLRSIVEDPGERIDRLVILPAEERATIDRWNSTSRSYDLDRPLHQWIEDQVVRAPDGIALEMGTRALSYGELNVAANRLAHLLQRRGVTAGDSVPILAERSLALVVGLLGTLKSGGAYVPLDPSYPVERLRFMIGDLSPKAVLVTADTRHLAIGVDSVLLVDVDELLGGSSSGDDGNLPFHAASDSPAYTIYTSGSTGAPKGAVNTHRGIVNRLLWMQETFGLTADDRVLQKTPYGFDVSVWEFFWPLMSGARLVLARPEGHRDNAYLANLIQQSGITTMHFVPPMLQAFLEEPAAARCDSLRRVICSGQELPAALQRRFFDVLPLAELHNLYGPTEAAVDVTWHHCSPADPRSFVPIGRPIANTSIYIVDRAGQPVPIGVPGELRIGGVQVARGYLNRPELTAEKFIPDPFDPFDRVDATMYRTGDLARFLADGEIEFLGRTDFQVKIRGLRVELGEIEHALTAHPQVREAVVLLREDRPGTKRLTAYVVAAEDVTQQLEGELRTALAASLPDYMIPDAFVRLDALPLTANGKVDRRALPVPQQPQARSRPPHSEGERKLAAIWKTVLGLEEVGAEDNFFSLGGDSIRSTQMLARARRDGFTLSVRDVLATPTIAALARAGMTAPAPTSMPVSAPGSMLRRAGLVRPAAGEEPAGDTPLMPMQQWFFDKNRAPLDHFNQSIVLRTPVVLRADVLREALHDLVIRHAGLRLRFPIASGGERQHVCVDPDRASLYFGQWAPGAGRPLAAAVRDCQGSFDLARGPLAAALLIDDPAAPRVLLIANHLIVDGVSWRVLLGDLEQAYRARVDGRVPVFAAEAASYLDWARASAAFAGSVEAESEALYWLSEDWSREFARLPIRERQGVDGPRVSEVVFDVPFEAVAPADEDSSGSGLEAALLASLSKALLEGATRHALRVDMEGHGREPVDRDTDGSEVVGWCTALYPVLLPIEGESVAERTASVARDLSDVPAGGRAFGLCRYLSPRGRVRDGLARIPQAEILFNYLGRLDTAARPGSLFTLMLPDASVLPQAQSPRYPLEVVAWREGDRVHVSLRLDRLLLDDGWARGLADRWAARLAEGASASYPLTSMQKGILFHALLNPDAGLYVQQVVVSFDAHPAPSVLRQAWDAVLAHHAILRTTFHWKGLEAPVQEAAVRSTMPWAVDDWREKSAEEFDAALEQFLDDDRARGIDLTNAPLQRVRLFLRDNGCAMVWTHHHLLLDGRSLFLVLRDVLEVSRALAANRRPALFPSASFGRIAADLDRVDPAPALEYWRGQLADVDAPTSIPFLGRASDPPRYRAGDVARTLSPADASALHALAREAGVTLNLLMQSLLALFVSRLSGSERVVFGATVSSERPDEHAVGLFINTIPIRVDVPARRQLGEWLRERLRAQGDRSPFEQLALVDIQRCSGISAGQTPFELLFLFENYPVDEALRASAPDVAVSGVRVVERTNYPIVLSVLPGERIDIRLLHDLSRYPADAARLFVEGYVATLRDVAREGRAGLDVSLDGVAPMDQASRQRILHDWNATARAYPRDRCVHELFLEQAAKRPDAVAVSCGEVSCTYGELAARARQIAADLLGRGIGAGSLVGICVERSTEMVAALLGILEAGAAYVPLDPAFPADRLAFMVEDSCAATILSERAVDPALRARLATGAPLVLLEDIGASPDQAAPSRPAGPDDLMYVIYTSGSTGRPKGVMIPHRAVMNILSGMAERPGLAAHDVLLAVTTLSFDIAVVELFLPLITGARIVLAERAADPKRLIQLIDEERVTVLQATPASWRMLIDAGWMGSPGLRAFCGGEALRRDLSRALLRRCGQLWNLYGPTETTVYSTAAQIHDADDGQIDRVESIGRPVANTSVYILNDAFQPVPVGAVGELCIAGEGLARGYLGNPQMTAERFVRDPFARDSDARMYRTGDRARFRPDGEIEFLGRLDDQVKIRGYRIELGEIESVLGAHPAVAHAAATIREDRPGEPRVIAYYAPREAAVLSPATDSDLREHLRARLPEYMIPSRFVCVDRMPLTPSGKVDRRALPAPDPVRHEPGTLEPSSRIEREVAAVWSEVLGDERFPADESFFNLGGHSLHLIRVQTRIAGRLGIDLDIVEFFRHPSIRQLAALIDRRQQGLAPDAAPAANRSAARLSRAGATQQQQHLRRDARARTRPE